MSRNKLDYMIKCKMGYMNWVYWSGVSWVEDIKRCRRMEKEEEAVSELAGVSIPRGSRFQPEIFKF